MRRIIAPGAVTWLSLVTVVILSASVSLQAQENDDCFMCHEDPDLTGERGGREIPVHVDGEAFAASVHADLDCVTCHQDLDGAEIPHEDDLAAADCAMCHDDAAAEYADSHHGARSKAGSRRAPTCADCHGAHDIGSAEDEASLTSHARANALCGECHRTQARQHASSLHGQAAARGDEMAPTCYDCHDNHQVRSRRDPDSPTSTMNIPVLCGKCHQEGSPVSRTHEIPQDHILENYSMSIHGEGLYRQGLTVTAVCTSCHTSHLTLSHEDPRSSIHRENITETCTRCHASIERVHRKFIEGRLWEEEPGKIPVCVDCHSPHKIRRVYYTAGAANRDCLACHEQIDLTMERDGEVVSLYVNEAAFSTSVHAATPCAQCHTDVDPSKRRPCETVAAAVDCSVCHAAVVEEYRTSTHGVLHAQGDPDAPGCMNCHSKHATQDPDFPTAPTFPRNVPMLCAKCHRAGEQAAVRIETDIPDIYASYVDSIHGKGLLESGLIVTATCASCHTAHGERPESDPESSVHRDNIAGTCGNCHHGIGEIFRESIHWPGNTETDRELPTCEDCHSSHTISRTDQDDFRFRMMDQCGRCHETEAETFFDTFHGKVSRLGSAGAAKCYDCHGTHDIRPTSDPRSALS
ncbi:MAG: hypothetical protein JRG91_20950, partial [Deltaproteobacteria bacterium]|nr:hypothetical protein [Deltaproteobacteria bacterium]